MLAVSNVWCKLLSVWTLSCSLWCDSLIQFTYLVAYSMGQSPSWEANRFSSSQEIPRILWNSKFHYISHKCLFRNTIHLYGEELLAPRPAPKLEDHPLSAVHDCLFNLFTATLHTGGRSSIRNLRTRHGVVTGTHLSQCNLAIRSVRLLSLCGGHLLHLYVISSPPHWCTEYSPNSARAFMERVYGKRCGITFSCVWWEVSS